MPRRHAGMEVHEMIGDPDAEPDGSGAALPTAPHSVVWSRGHLYVLEASMAGWRWVGMGDRGRPRALTSTELNRLGWSPQCGRVAR